MNHKSFVFFDCECANTFNGAGKICSLGYVITDDDLNVIESEDVVINPECEFDWYLLSGKGECKLAYSKDYFRAKPNFESYFKNIKKMFTTGNRYIAGFAVDNDVGFVNSACQRYNLDLIQFRAFDVAKILEKHYGTKRKLFQWAEFFKIDMTEFSSHKSVDDAMVTMLCLKKYCEATGKSAEEVFTENKAMFISSEQMLLIAEERAYRREVIEKIKRLYGKKNPKPRHKTLLDQVFELDGGFFQSDTADIDETFQLVKDIYESGGTVREHCKAGATVIFNCSTEDEISKGAKAKLEKKGLSVIPVDVLIERMNG